MSYLFAYITSAAIAIAYRGPLRAIPGAGLAGLLGWAGYHASRSFGAPEMLAVSIGAFMLGTTGEVLARMMREPTPLFVVPGLFPLVPGLLAYNGMLFLAREELVSAGQALARTGFYAAALAAGLALPPAIFRLRR